MVDKLVESVTAGGVVIGPDGKIVVVNQHGNSWSLPKGHLESGETAFVAAVREIKEETGITDLELIEALGTYKRYRIGLDKTEDKNTSKLITLFLFRTNQNELLPEDPDNPEARWLPIDEAADILTHRKDREFLLSVIPKIKQQLPQ